MMMYRNAVWLGATRTTSNSSKLSAVCDFLEWNRTRPRYADAATRPRYNTYLCLNDFNAPS